MILEPAKATDVMSNSSRTFCIAHKDLPLGQNPFQDVMCVPSTDSPLEDTDAVAVVARNTKERVGTGISAY
jgi:hypothetical protein